MLSEHAALQPQHGRRACVDSKTYLYASFVSCHSLGNNRIVNPAWQLNRIPLLREVWKDGGKRSEEGPVLGTAFKGHFACYA